MCVGEAASSPRGLDSKAKLPMQRRAVEASNKLLHVIWMRLELLTEQPEDPGHVWIQLSLFPRVCDLDLTLLGCVGQVELFSYVGL